MGNALHASRSQEEFGIELRALQIVVAVMAHERCDQPPPTAEQAYDTAEVPHGTYPLGRLVAKRWLVVVGRGPGGGHRPRYRAHPRAWAALGFEAPRDERRSA